MADLRIVDAPEIPTENITGQEKIPTGGSGNYSITLDSVADYTKTKKDLADNTSVDGKVNGVKQELNTHIEDLLNPHQVTKGQIGLGNVDNTADADKPVSNSTQAAIISAVTPKADKTYVDNQLTLKANKTDVYTKSETYTKQESSDLVNNSISTALTPVNASLDLAKRGIDNRYDSALTYNSGERLVMPNGTPVISRINNNTIDPAIDFSNWATEDNCVRPEMFDERAGLSNNPDIDTPAFKKAVATGRFVRLTSGRNYKLKEEVTPNNGAPLVVFGDQMGPGETGATISAASGFAGYMLKPKTGYDIRDVRIVGSGIDGCFPIGNDADSSTGLARIERFYFSNCDIGINFGDKWEHPWGLYYNQIVGLGTRTGGINLGGNSGGAAASSGESAWTMDNILLIASSNAGNVGSGGIEAPSIVVTQSVTSTTDKITWDNTATPYYGWCVMRSANGTTNWHVPPNWTSDLFLLGEFTATKTSGETWNYKVIRMTKGLNIRRAKAVNIGVAQCEYFGIGTQLTDVPNSSLAQSYSESREKTVPLSNYCSIRLNNSALTLGGGWCEKSSYGISVWANSVLSLTGTYSSRNCILGKAQMGGSTQQQMYLNKLNATSGTPDKIVGPGSIYDFAIQEWKYYDDGIHLHVDGANSSGYHVFRRGVEKAKLAVETNGLSVVQADTARIDTASKTLVPSFANEATTSPLTLGTATKFLTLSNITANAGGVAKFDMLLIVRDGLSVARQVMAGTLKVQYLRASSGDVVASVKQETTVLNQQGTLNSVVFSAAGVGGALDVSANVDTSLPSGGCSIQLVPLSILGSASRSIVMSAT